jgi:formylglycine-generating enzyme required for sulfatase activity
MNKLGYFLLLLPLLFAFGKNKKPQTTKYLTKHYVKVPAGKVHLRTGHYKSGEEALKYRRTWEEAEKLGLDSEETQDYLQYREYCHEFFIYKTEVTNGNWKEFLSYLKQNGRMDEYKGNMLDTNVWRHRMSYNEPFVSYYYQHSAYAEYPAVGLTLKQATAYANWLTEIYGLKNQGVKITFSVPTKKQWIRAARGSHHQQYPWFNSIYLRNSNGTLLANFKDISERHITYDRVSNEYKFAPQSFMYSSNDTTITAPAESYFPNQFGIYNMSGNVAELVSDDTVAMGGSWNDTGYDVRVESEQPATDPRSTIGFRVVAVIE